MTTLTPHHLEHIGAVARRQGIDLDDTQLGQLDRYAGLLVKWNKVVPLVSRKTTMEAIVDGIIDSLAVASLVGAHEGDWLDVGSGGGFPAVVVAMLRPDLRGRWLEPRARKAAFLRVVASELGLRDITVAEARLQDLPEEGAFDLVTSRATLAPLELFGEAALRVRPTGAIVLATTTDTSKALEEHSGRFLVAETARPRGPKSDKICLAVTLRPTTEEPQP